MTGQMKLLRDLAALAADHYDVLIVGGGIYGAALAWEAASRGLHVALVEKADFGAETSANSLKIIHGGLRYLQHADLKRLRESSRERRALLRIAPHLVHPLPTVVPAYGHGVRGREALALAVAANDLLSADRHRGLADPQKRIPRGQVLSRERMLALAPGIEREGLTGGVLYYDAQVMSAERLPLAFLRSAIERGARVANYAEATGLLREGERVIGAQVTDRLTGEVFEVRARLVVGAAGPWVNRLLDRAGVPQRVGHVKAINVIVPPLFEQVAVGLPSRSRDGGRLFFVAPWRGVSLVGTYYVPAGDDPDALHVTREEVEAFLAAVNRAYPPAGLAAEYVTFVHAGLLPAKGSGTRLARRPVIREHGPDGAPGLLTVVGVKYTTARAVAERTVNRIFRLGGQTPPRSISATTPLYGGDIERFDDFLREQVRQDSLGIGEGGVMRLVYHYGSALPDVLRYADGGRGPDAALRAEVLYAVREEMAQTLADVVLRRTGLGTAGHPGETTLRRCAGLMAAELGWSEARIRQEIEDVNAAYPAWTVRREVVDGAELADRTV